MTSGSKSKFCIICSSTSGVDEEDRKNGDCKSSFLFGHPQFSQFCGELELCGGVNEKHRVFSASDFLFTFAKASELLFLCSGCTSLVTHAVENKEKLDQIEVEVLKLQIELLTRMEALRQSTEFYFKDMWRIFEKVRNADAGAFEENDIVVGHRKKKCDVLLFREKIMDVVTYLGMFYDGLSTKVLTRTAPPTYETLVEETFPPQTTQQKRPTSKSLSKKWKPTSAALKQAENYQLNSEPQSSPVANDGGVVDNLESTDFMGMMNDCDDMDDDMGSPFPFESEDIETGSVVERGVEDEIVKIERAMKDACDKNDTAHLDPKNKESNDPIPPKKKKMEGYKSPEGKKKNLIEIDFSKMGRYKAKFIVWASTRPQLTFEQLKAASNPNAHDSRHLFHWNYCPSSDQMTFEGCRVMIEDLDNTIKLMCATCGHRTHPRDLNGVKEESVFSGFRVLEGRMLNHIVAHHLENGFKCHFCSESLRSIEKFTLHLTKHQSEVAGSTNIRDIVKRQRRRRKEVALKLKPQQWRCDICNNNFKTQRTLFFHKQHHKTPEERSQSKDCPDVLNLPCSVCGRTGFNSIAGLAIHEETHRDKDKRPTIVCPLCGTKMLKVSYRQHKVYRCSGTQQMRGPQVCDECGKQFTNIENLKAHKLRLHTEEYQERTLPCQDCDKIFKLKKDLYRHRRKIHKLNPAGEFLPHLCRKGCGKRFAWKIFMQKHEGTCKGPKIRKNKKMNTEIGLRSGE